MPVSGDFAGLEKLRKAMASLATPEAKRGMSVALAGTATTLVQRTFQRSTDPYGKQWKPLSSRDGIALRDTGRLMNSLTRVPAATASGFTISTGVRYAAVHQYGATIKAKTNKGLRFRVGGPRGRGQWVRKQRVTIPRRQFMPEGQIGPVWRADLEATANRVMARTMGAK